MNSHLYSAYPDEREILLMEGTPVAVLGVEQFRFDENIESEHAILREFANKEIDIVYMFHAKDLNPAASVVLR